MNRRELIGGLCGAAALPLAWPLAARAQPQPIRPLIGFLSPLSAASAARNVAAFRAGLRDLGYLEGHNATLALRFGDGAPERMAPLAQELGVAQSIARPGGNITGTWFDYDALVSKRLEFLKLAVPALTRVGVILN